MKSQMTVLILATMLIAFSAQASKRYDAGERLKAPAGTLSKDVQRIMHYEDQQDTFRSLGYPAWTLSKKVNEVNNDRHEHALATRWNISSQGYTAPAISKSIQYTILK
jgi:uncharacterized protein YpuA (DUF1002 family)